MRQVDDDAVRAFTIACLVFTCAFVPVALALFVRRRRRQPILSRHPSIVAVATLAGVVYISTEAMATLMSDDLIDPIWRSTNAASIGITLWLHCYRCWLFYYSAGLANEVANVDASNGSWFRQHRHLASNQFAIHSTVAIVLLFAMPTLAFAITHPVYQSTSHANAFKAIPSVRIVVQMQIGEVLAMSIAVGVMAYKLKGLRDILGIITEFAWLARVGVVVVLLNIAYVTLDISGGVPACTQLVACLAVIVITVGFPVYRSFLHDRLQTECHRMSNPVLLERFLAVRANFDAMRTFMINEYAVESLLFWVDNNNYVAMFADPMTTTMEERRARALHIYRTYFAPGAPLPVNVGWEVTHELKRRFAAIGEPQPRRSLLHAAARRMSRVGVAVVPVEAYAAWDRPDLFERARIEIVRLIHDSLLYRFQAYPEYARLWDDFLQQDNAMRALTYVSDVAVVTTPSAIVDVCPARRVESAAYPTVNGGVNAGR